MGATLGSCQGKSLKAPGCPFIVSLNLRMHYFSTLNTKRIWVQEAEGSKDVHQSSLSL